MELTVAGKSTTAGTITSPAGTFSPYRATGSMLDMVLNVLQLVRSVEVLEQSSV